jgi:hypothetical protein
MCYGENGTVKFLETLADNVFRHNYSMMQILKKLNYGKIFRLPSSTKKNVLVLEASNKYTHLFLVEKEYFGFNTLECYC